MLEDMTAAPWLTRRTFLKNSAWGTALVAAGSSGLRGVPASARYALDAFGGWTGKSFEATGFFRTHHDGTRWWLVTPAGNAFITFGLNHYHSGWWYEDYNRDHWNKKFGVSSRRDPAWAEGWRRQIGEDLDHLGLNTIGIHTNDPETGGLVGGVAPYVARFDPVKIPHFLTNTGPDKFHDIFSDDFDRVCADQAREQVVPRANDPLVLGFSMTDCPLFTDWDSAERGMTIYGAPRAEMPSWPRVLRNLGSEAPGKQAYVASMRDRYGDGISGFNRTYGTAFATWHALAAARDWRPRTDYANDREIEDNTAFLRACVETYYRKARAALRRFDSHHLFLGDKLNGNSNQLDVVLDITARYTDVVFYQIYGHYEDHAAMMDQWTDRVDIPFLNGDSTFSYTSDMMPSPYGPQAENQAQRAEWITAFGEAVFARPDFVGWHLCGVIDTLRTMRGKDAKQHAGVMNPWGEYYPEVEAAVQSLSTRLYALASQA